MPQDAYTLRRVALALDEVLAGGKVEKIVQPSKDEVSLVIYTGKRSLKLTLNTNASDCGAYFTDGKDAPAVAPSFCMLLRKYLHGAELLSVALEGFERVMRFRFRANTDFSTAERELVLEVMGKYSNLMLLEGGMILGALKTTTADNAKRLIFAGTRYVLPARQEKADPSSEEKIAAALGENRSANAVFSRLAGIAPVTAEHIAENYRGGDFAKYVHAFLFDEPDFPCADEHDFYAYPVEEAKKYPSLLEAQSAFYIKKRNRAHIEGERRKLSNVLSAAKKKAEKKLSVLLEKRLSCNSCEENRKKGELITAYLWQLSRGMKSCVLTDYESGKEVKISLDERLTPAENAQLYFKKYRKQKRALELLDPMEEETRSELLYLSSLLALVSSAAEEEDFLSLSEEMTSAGLLSPPKEKKQVKKEIPFRVFEVDGFRILAGRNNLQNDKLVRSCSPDDIWLHAQRVHSCHAVVRAEGKKVPDGVLQFAANVCAKYSDGGGKVPVDYCLLKFVKKPKGSKAGFVVYSQFSTLLGDPEKV